MDVRAISPDGDLHKKVYTWHNQMVLLWKEKNIAIPLDDIRS